MYSNYPTEPDYPAAMGLLSHLNVDELKEMLNDDAKFDEMMKDVKQFKELETEKEMLMASNRSLAEFNLSREPRLSSGKQRLQELGARGEELCASVEAKLQALRSHSGNLTLDTSLALLQTAAAESEEESEALFEKFAEGEADVDGFLEQFLPRRKMMHARRVKAEKMQELMAARARGASSGLYPVPPAPSGPAPYPTAGGMGLPMPGRFVPGMY
ncbi:vacuolar protein sorting-associated protein 37B [Bacillus rossius redtenbacheri]|uniref:vacuolar protein sorting-associated protein 37B n=1 Tax=Bacillus rossius redtenbacheri TaxID=93214 RepID=UPI002FDDA767